MMNCPDKDFGVARAKNLLSIFRHPDFWEPFIPFGCDCSGEDDSPICTLFIFW